MKLRIVTITVATLVLAACQPAAETNTVANETNMTMTVDDAMMVNDMTSDNGMMADSETGVNGSVMTGVDNATDTMSDNATGTNMGTANTTE